jgi:hypothetical protein
MLSFGGPITQVASSWSSVGPAGANLTRRCCYLFYSPAIPMVNQFLYQTLPLS